jgi:hypothetical protein
MIFIEACTCVPLFFSSQKLAYHYFCSVWEGLICAYHYFCSVFISFVGQFRLKCTKHERFPADFVKNRPWIFHYGFQLYSLCNFSFFGPGRAPPHKGTSKEHFVEEFTIGIKKGNFLDKNAGMQHSGLRKWRYTRFRLEKNSTGIVRTTIFVVFGRA